MRQLAFWFDVISPYAYLAFERLPQALDGLPVVIDYRPLLFAGLLGHWGQKGPAEIEPKRAWTFRHVGWLAHRHGVTLQTPAQHPFNPLALLRLAIARGIFGVPTVEVDGRLFWGVDSLEMLVAYLRGDPWFDGPGWQASRTTIPGVVRS